MPFLQKKDFAFNNHRFDAAHIDRLDAFAACLPDGQEPELAFTVAGIDVNARRLGTFIRISEPSSE